MRTQNPRINITLESAAAGLLRHLAHKEHKSVAGLARELIVESLERREDVEVGQVLGQEALLLGVEGPVRDGVHRENRVAKRRSGRWHWVAPLRFPE